MTLPASQTRKATRKAAPLEPVVEAIVEPSSGSRVREVAPPAPASGSRVREASPPEPVDAERESSTERRRRVAYEVSSPEPDAKVKPPTPVDKRRTRFSADRSKARKPKLLNRRPCPPQFASRHRVQKEPRIRGSAATATQQRQAATADSSCLPLLPFGTAATSKAAARPPASMSTLVSASSVSAAGEEGFVVEESFVAPAGSIGVAGAMPQREQASRDAAHRAFLAAGRDGLRGRMRPAMPRTPEQAATLWQEEQSAWLTGIDTNVVVALWRFGIRIASDLAYLFTSEGEAMDFLELVVPEFTTVAMSTSEAQALHTPFLSVWYRARKASEPEVEHRATAAMVAHRRHIKSGETAQASAQEEVRRPATSLGEPGSSIVLTAAPTDHQVMEEHGEAHSKRQGLVKRLFDVFMSLGSQGALWDGEDVEVSERRAVFSSALVNVTAEKMSSML